MKSNYKIEKNYSSRQLTQLQLVHNANRSACPTT